MKKHVLLCVLFCFSVAFLFAIMVSCKTSKDARDMNVLTMPTIIDTITDKGTADHRTLLKVEDYTNFNSLEFEGIKKPTLISRIFGSKKTNLKKATININYQTATGGSTIAPVAQTGTQANKDKGKVKTDEKLKGQNAVKGDGNTSTAAKSDKSLMWVLIAVGVIGVGVIGVGGFIVYKKKLI